MRAVPTRFFRTLEVCRKTWSTMIHRSPGGCVKSNCKIQKGWDDQMIHDNHNLTAKRLILDALTFKLPMPSDMAIRNQPLLLTRRHFSVEGVTNKYWTIVGTIRPGQNDPMSWENQVSWEEAIKDTSREIVPSVSWADLLTAITSKLQQLQVFGSLWCGNRQWFRDTCYFTIFTCVQLAKILQTPWSCPMSSLMWVTES